jgi:hypothetical protein
LMTVAQDMAWGFCLGTVGALLVSAFLLMKIDVNKRIQPVVAAKAQEGPGAA